MANLLAIEINDEDILVVAARSSGKRLQFTKIFEVPVETTDSASDIGNKLKASLNQNSIPRGEVFIVLGRQMVEMRNISVPPAPENELPDLVKFQARSDFSSFNENWAMDYVPFDCQADQQQVLAATLGPQLIEQHKTIVEQAGLKLSKALLRPYSTCELFRAEMTDGKGRMIIDPNDEQVDLTVVTGPELIATRSVRTSGDYETAEVAQKLAGEIRRTITSSAKLLNGTQLEEFLIVGAESRLPHLAKLLQENFDQTVTFIDPYTTAPGISNIAKELPSHPERFAGLIGALLRESSGKPHLIDFENPRKPKTDHNKRPQIMLFGGLAAAMLICIAVLGWWLLRSQNAQIATLNKDLNALKKVNKGDKNQPGVEQITGEVNLIDQWENNNINWLNELYEFSKRLETPDDAIVDSMTLTANERAVGLTIKGRVNSITMGSVLKNNLTGRPYLVTAGRTLEEADDKDYPIKLESMFVELPTDLNTTIERINTLARERRNEELPDDDTEQPTAPNEPSEESSETK